MDERLAEVSVKSNNELEVGGEDVVDEKELRVRGKMRAHILGVCAAVHPHGVPRTLLVELQTDGLASEPFSCPGPALNTQQNLVSPRDRSHDLVKDVQLSIIEVITTRRRTKRKHG